MLWKRILCTVPLCLASSRVNYRSALRSKSCINVLLHLNNSKYRRRLINDQISLNGRVYTQCHAHACVRYFKIVLHVVPRYSRMHAIAMPCHAIRMPISLFHLSTCIVFRTIATLITCERKSSTCRLVARVGSHVADEEASSRWS